VASLRGNVERKKKALSLARSVNMDSTLKGLVFSTSSWVKPYGSRSQENQQL